MSSDDNSLASALEEMIGRPACSAADLIDRIATILQNISGVRVRSIWSSIASGPDTASKYYIRTYDADISIGIDHRAAPQSKFSIIENNRGLHVFTLPLSFFLSPSVSRKITYIIVTDIPFPSPDTERLSKTLLRLMISRNFNWFQGLIRDRVIESTASSTDLNSFLNKIIRKILKEWFDTEACTFFYYDKTTDSLVQATGTGIRFQQNNRLKNSDIRYFMDSPSYTVRCYTTGRPFFEMPDFQGQLRPNTYGENVDEVTGRAYFPLKICERSHLDSDLTEPIGVVRIANFNKNVGGKYLSSLQAILLEYTFEMAALFGKRYIRVHSILHDQERSTHGYSTDLLTIAFACRVVQRWLEGPAALTSNAPALVLMRNEISNRVRTIVSVQENMSHQLVTIARHRSNSFFDVPSDDRRSCGTPYKDVFLRIIDSKAGISACYSRPELIVTSRGEKHFSEDFTRMPAVAMSVGELYMIVRNLVENAIKYTAKSEKPMIDITWKIDGRDVVYHFRDFGIGVPVRDRLMLGREGFRGHEARRVQLRGNGLEQIRPIPVHSRQRRNSWRIRLA